MVHPVLAAEPRYRVYDPGVTVTVQLSKGIWRCKSATLSIASCGDAASTVYAFATVTKYLRLGESIDPPYGERYGVSRKVETIESIQYVGFSIPRKFPSLIQT